MRAPTLGATLLVLAALAGAPRWAHAQANDLEAPENGRGARAEDERAAPREGEGPRDAAEPAPAPPWRWPGSIVWDWTFRGVVPLASALDDALRAHGYGDVRFIPSISTGFAVPAGVEWLWLGAQLGVRGRTFSHAEHDAASLVGIDLVAMARARALLGQRVELGLAVGGGVGWIGVWLNGVLADQAAPRFLAQLELAFRIGRHLGIGPRIGWDYFQSGAINAYGHGAEAGGPFFGFSMEGRE